MSIRSTRRSKRALVAAAALAAPVALAASLAAAASAAPAEAGWECWYYPISERWVCNWVPSILDGDGNRDLDIGTS
jgi:Spy/CpxP family protein refolding chaperone